MNRVILLAAMLGLSFALVTGPQEALAFADNCVVENCVHVSPNRNQKAIDVKVDQAFLGAKRAQTPGTHDIPGSAAPAARAGSAGQLGPSAPTAPTNPTNPAPPVNSFVAAEADHSRAVECIILIDGPPPPCWKQQHPAATPAQATPAQPAASAAAIRQLVASYLQRLPLPAPGIHLNPAQPAIVNFPTIVNADPPPTTHFVISPPGFPRIEVTARCHWQWDFGDGAHTSTDWPGRPYDGTLPADDPQHYLLHTYRNPGTLTVTVTGVWSATYTVAGVPDTTPMAGTVSRASSTTLTVGEYAANLIP